jgi:uncharacterized coiled-coil protein SlyX
MERTLEQRIEELEKRVAELEKVINTEQILNTSHKHFKSYNGPDSKVYVEPI